jgi:hypothetical protein
MCPSINLKKFHLAVADILLSEVHHVFILASSILAASFAMRSTRLIFKATEKVFFEPRQPFVEGLARDPEVTTGQGYVLSVLLPEDDPFQTSPGSSGQPEKLCNFAPSGMFVSKSQSVSAGKISWLEGCPKPTALLLGDGCGHGCDELDG